uniref:Uncharacterized protein n=1 Tax=Avena sativa TaxID=4498 RepID=A0ACD5TBW1_AVESA
MVDMEGEEEEEKQRKRPVVVVGITRRHVTGSASPPPSSPPPPDSNRNESEGGDHTAEFRRKKGKTKPKAPLKWRSTNSDMNHRNGEAEGSDGDRADDDTVLSSLAAAGSSFRSLISNRKGVRTLGIGKVAGGCDAVDPPVPRKLRSAINKRAGRTVSPRHVKKRRHLSAISAQIFLMDHETRFDEPRTSNPFTQEEQVLADTLLALSQNAPLSEPTAAEMGKGEDISSINVASTSCSKGAMKKDNEMTVLPIDDAEVIIQPAPVDQQVEQTGSVPQENPDLNAPNNNIILHLPKDGQIQDLSLGLVTTSSDPSKASSNNSAWKKPKVQFDGSLTLTNPRKSEAPHWLVNCSKPGFLVHDRTKDGNNSVQGVMPPVQTPLPSTSEGYSTNPSSSTSGLLTKSVTGTSKASATENNPKLSLSKNGEPTKKWKKSMNHVYVSHLIQAHLDKEKAPQNLVKHEEISRSHISMPPSGSIMNKSKAHLDATHPVQQSHPNHQSGFRDAAAGRQKMVSSSHILNLPTSAGFSGAQYIQYLHPQMVAHRGPTPYPYPHHLPCSRGNLAPTSTMTVQQQMQQYMGNPGYGPHSGPPASSAAMKHQQFVPTPQQQQQMWQFHFSQYHQPRPSEGGPPVSWQNSRLQDMASSSLRPILAPRPPQAMMPQMELLCAPYHGSGGGGRGPPQLRLI